MTKIERNKLWRHFDVITSKSRFGVITTSLLRNVSAGYRSYKQCKQRVCLILSNSSPLSAAYMRQWIRSALVQVMACRLFGAKPLSKPMLGYCQLDPEEQTPVKFQSTYKTFHLRKCIKRSSAKWRPSCPRRDALSRSRINMGSEFCHNCVCRCLGHQQAYTWWRHQMETFSALLALCEGNPPVNGGFP